MKKIKLNNFQLKNLLENDCLSLNENSVLQLVKNRLFLNVDGDIYNMINVDFHFKKQEIEHEFVVDDIKQLVCEHLNLDPSEVIFSDRHIGAFDFTVRFDVKNEWNIIVCDYSKTIQNTRELSDETLIPANNANQIGLYKRLGDSCYYFRWFQKI